MRDTYKNYTITAM